MSNGVPNPGHPAHPGYPVPTGPPWGAPQWGPYAGWGSRVMATLLDSLLLMLSLSPAIVSILFLSGDPVTSPDGTTSYPQTSPIAVVLIVIGYALYFGFFVWNLCWRQGRTGQSLGKKILGIVLISEQSGQPVGAGMSFVRQLAHILDYAPCYLGYLWPIWDAKSQTFADKVCSTVVINGEPPTAQVWVDPRSQGTDG